MHRVFQAVLAVAAAALLSIVTLSPAQAAAPKPVVRFTVEVRGRGPDVILIPGLASSRAVWDQIAAELVKTHRVHLVQVAGFAGSPVSGNAEGKVVEPLADGVAAYIAAQKLNNPAVIGHSMGGLTGLLIATRHPDRIGRLMVVDALPFFSVLINPESTAQSIAPQAAGFRDMILGQSPEAFVAGQTQAMAGLVKTPEARAQPIAWSLATDRGVMARATHEVMTTDLRGDLAAVKIPVTVLYARDPQMGYAYGVVGLIYERNYATLPGVTLTPVNGAFHFIMLDQPQTFAAEVGVFLK